jgi:hypothetical protein
MRRRSIFFSFRNSSIFVAMAFHRAGRRSGRRRNEVPRRARTSACRERARTLVQAGDDRERVVL